MRSLCGQLAQVAALSGAWAEIVCMDNFEGVDPTSPDALGGRNATDQRLGAMFEKVGHGHLKCEGLDSEGSIVQVTAELRGANIGFKAGWQSANPFGEVRWALTDVNGEQLPEFGEITIPQKYQKYLICGDNPPNIGNGIAQFSDALVLENKLQPASARSATITALAFLNDAKKASVLNGNEVYSLEQDMGGCKMEFMVKVPVNTAGDTTFAININFHMDNTEANPKAEEELNAGLTARNVNGMVVIDSALTTSDGSKTALAMAESLICVKAGATTGTSLDSKDVTISDLSGFPADRSFTYTIPKAVTDAGQCDFLYWDPTATPFATKGKGTRDSSSSDTSNALGTQLGLASLLILLPACDVWM